MKNKQIKIDFAIVGEPKSGTTAMANFLSQHPGVAFSIPKETAYFSTDFHRESDTFHGSKKYFHYRNEEDFKAIFTHALDGQILGEGTTGSLYSKEAAGNIYNHNPKTRIIMMFRNPVDMIHSLHMQYLNETVEDIGDFEQAILAEEDRMKGKRIPKRVRCPSYLFYKYRTNYTSQIKRYYDLFDKKQIKVIIFDDFINDNEKYTKEIYAFLGLDTSFEPHTGTIHESKTARSKTVNMILNNPLVKKILNKAMGPQKYTKVRDFVAKIVMKKQVRKELPAELRTKLENEFKQEVTTFGEYIDRDLLEIWGYK